MLKGSFFKTSIISSVAKSDEIGKIAHLVFSREIMGADILEKLSLNSLYHSMHAAHSQKLSLTLNVCCM